MTTLHECAVILPRDIAHLDVLASFENALITEFGGFTRTFAFGGWRAPDGRVILEPVSVYAIAIRRNATDTARLTCLAAQMRELLDQEEVYIKLPTGQVVFINADTETGGYV